MDEQEWQVPRLCSGECDWMDWLRKMIFPMPCSDAKQGKNAFAANPERKFSKIRADVLPCLWPAFQGHETDFFLAVRSEA